MAASASTTITFAVTGTSDDSDISVELDDELNGDKTTFKSGDTVYFNVYTNPTDLSVTVDTTLGSTAENGSKSVEQTETISFVKSKTASLSKLPAGAVSYSYIGRSGGTPTFSGKDVTVPTEINALMKCTYSATAKAYKLSGVTIPTGETEIQVLVVVSPA